jgi:hypothetical protein
MKHTVLATILVFLLVVSALFTVISATNYYFSVKSLEQVRFQLLQINNIRGAMQSLANDAVEYSKRHPDLTPILKEFEARPPVPASTNSPAAPARPSR